MLDAYAKLLTGKDLDEMQARELADGFFDGALVEDAMRKALLALNNKKITVDEIVGFAQSMRKHALPISPGVAVADTCGTGGDGMHTFNISTAAAILASACGVKVAKHGNRSASGLTGSADVLSVLGVSIDLPPNETCRRIQTDGFGFLFAPLYHPAMKKVAPVRKALGVKTIFNLLGPLTNPAKPTAQVIGAYSTDAQDKIAEATARLGIDRAIIVHSEGNDEAGVGKTRVLDANKSHICESFIIPSQFGIRGNIEELKVQDGEQSAKKIIAALENASGFESKVVCLNAALAMVAAGKVSVIEDGIALAQEAVLTGKALEKLDQIKEEQKP